ncbi:MAG: NAD(P)-dependent alcohol dehydrogenase [Myxococcales bacterium]|nr:NAD(P)-dependent alcohol dehydrogenase [Myxococcales bacterium]
MQAAIHTQYGAPESLTVGEAPIPSVGADQVVVRVFASPVTQGDRHVRAADFPGIGWLPGRLMMGLLRPKNRVPGGNFAGRVVEVGADVTRFAVGDDVFGACDSGAQAEFVAVKAEGAIAKMPAGVRYDEIADAPYGAGTAVTFLEKLAELGAGERVLILGASGGVGRAAVQIAKARGAEVTGVASAAKADLVRALGADHVLDYRAVDPTTGDRRYDVVFDTAGRIGFRQVRRVLARRGRFLTTRLSASILFWMLLTKLFGARRALFGLALPDAALVERVRALFEAGALRPVIDQRFPLTRIAQAHVRVESGAARGSVVITLAEPEPLRVAA